MLVRASTDSLGLQVLSDSFDPVISADGLCVSFYSYSNSLVSGDSNNTLDVFTKNLLTGLTTRVSTDTNGVQGNSFSYSPSINSTGRYVAFQSFSSNLIPGDTNGTWDVFLKDTLTGSLISVSKSSSGVEGNGSSSAPSISIDGRYVVFQSMASNLVDGDTNGASDIFISDTQTGQIARLSVDSSLVEGNNDSVEAFLSSDGRYVAFTSFAGNLASNDTNEVQDVFITANPFFVSVSQVGPLSSPNGFTFDVDAQSQNAGQLINGLNNSFDGYNRLKIDGIDFSTFAESTWEDGDRTIITSTTRMSGLDIHREVTVPATGTQDFVRTIDVFNNTSSDSLTVPVGLFGNVGSDVRTTIFATSDGDLIVEPTDTWFGTDDDKPNGGSPAIIHMLQTDFPLRTAAANIGVVEDNVAWAFNLTVPAGQTRRLASFAIQGTTRQQAISSTNALIGSSGFAEQSGVYLSSEEMQTLANFQFSRAPSDIEFTGQSFFENNPLNATVGTFATSDSNTLFGDSFTYSLVAGIGSNDNSAFIIQDNELRANKVFDYEEKSSYSIRVRTTDAAGLFTEKQIGILVTDMDEIPPSVASSSIPATGVVTAGAMTLSITFSESGMDASNPLQYELRRAGGDGLLLDTDTPVNPASVSYSGSTVSLTFADAFTIDTYRLTIHDSAVDSANNALDGDGDGIAGGYWEQDFVVAPNAISLVSVAGSGIHANGLSDSASASFDGRFVAFSSLATNLVEGDTNGLSDIYVRDNNSQGMLLASSSSTGAIGNGSSFNPVLSADGRFVVFSSQASNLALDDNNGVEDLFVKDLQTNEIHRVSTDSNGAEGNGVSDSAVINSDGRFVVFTSSSSNLASGDSNSATDVFVKDRLTGTTSLVSSDTNGIQGNGASYRPSLSRDGRYVAFLSAASNLVLNDSNSAIDVFVKDLETGKLTRISTSTINTQSDGNSDSPWISSDGRYVVFTSTAGNLVDGSPVGRRSIFVKDTSTDILTLVSTNVFDVPANLDSFRPVLSADGRYVAFESQASNLIDGDTNSLSDVFIKDLKFGEVRRLSASSLGTQGNGSSYAPSFNGDGTSIVFAGEATNLLPLAVGPVRNIFQTKNPLLGASDSEFLPSSNQINWDVSNTGFNGQINQGPYGAFDGMSRLEISGNRFITEVASTWINEGKTLVSPIVQLSGIDMKRETTVSSISTVDFARTINIFHNESSSPLTLAMRFFGNLGSDKETNVFATSDGDQLIEPTDSWFATDDADPNGGSPAIVHLIRSGTGIRPTYVALNGDNVDWIYSITLNPGETTRLSSFTFIGTTRQSVLDAMEAILLPGGSDLIPEAYEYLSQEEISSIANFQANPAPTDILLSNATITENESAPALVGVLSTVDESSAESYSYSLVDGEGSDDNGSFLLLDGQLLAQEEFDFESKNSYTIRLRSTDQGGAWVERVFEIQVLDANDPPRIANPLQDTSVLEDSIDTIIDLSELFTDDNSGMTLSVTSSNSNVVATSLNGTLLTISYPANAFGAAIVSVSATDTENLTSTDAFFLEVHAVNDAPLLVNPIEDVSLLEFGNPLSIDVSNLFFDIDDANLLLSIATSDPSLLSARIVDSKLVLSGFPRSNGTTEITISASDHQGLEVSDTFLVTVKDDRPELTITGPSDGFLGITGQPRQFQLVANSTSESSITTFAYEILWGDDSPIETISGNGFLNVTHTYWNSGQTRILARAIDGKGNASDWQILDLNIQRYELQNDILAIGGTPLNDQFVVSTSSSKSAISITLNRLALGVLSVPVGGVSLHGYDGNDQVIFNGTMSDDIIAFEDNKIRWAGLEDPLNLRSVDGGSIERFILQTIGGNDTIRIISGTVEVDGGSGEDLLQGPNTGADWIVEGLGTGTLQGSPFKFIESIQGGSGDDSFHIDRIGFLTGTVDGKDGLDTIDYSQRVTAVDVNLALEKATGVGGMVNVERFIGSGSASDRLWASNSDNRWNLSDVGDPTLGSSITFQGFENLYGGAFADRFVIAPSTTNIPKLNGGLGIDSLDYQLWDLPVTVQQHTRSATSVPSFTSVENFIGGSAADTMVGANYDSNWRLNGIHSGTFSRFGSFSNFEKVVGGSSSDNFIVEDSFQGEIVGGNGTDTLTGPLQNNAWQLNGFRSGRVNDRLAFSEIENLRGNTSDDTFMLANNGSGFQRILGGLGFDQLNYSDREAPISVSHNFAPGVSLFGSIESIVGTNGSDTIVGNDVNMNWMISGKDEVLSHTVTFHSFENIVGGAQSDRFILSSPSSFLSGSIHGGGGNDTLNGSSVSNTWTLNGFQSGILNGNQSFNEIENLNGGLANDLYQFASIANGFGKINGGGGFNSLDFSAIETPLTVNLASATADIFENFVNIDSLVGSSSNFDTIIGRDRNTQWIIGGSSGNRVGGILFSSFERLQGGAKNDNFSIQDSIPIQVDGGSGADSIIGPAVDNVWRISGAGSGAIDDSLHFRSMENIYGGQADDVVIIEPLGSVPNLLNGGRGINTLSYAGWTSDVEVNGISGAATAVQNLVSNFQIIIGGSGNDRLTAFNFGGSVLVGNAGNDILTSRIGRALLFGGLGADQLIGSRYDDLISAGITSFDNDTAALKAIRAEWNSVRTYAQRVGNIRGISVTSPSLNGPYYLSNTPVDRIFDDSAVDSLFGGLGSDWYIQTTQDVSDRGSKEMVDDPR